MKKKIFILLVILGAVAFILNGCSIKSQEATAIKDPETTIESTNIFIDDMGRQIELANEVKKVYCTSPVGTIFVYTIAPEKLAGWNFYPSELEQKYLLESTLELPELGGWFGKSNTGNIEEIINAAPDLILDIGDVDDTSKSFAKDLYEKTNIPVVLINASKVSDFPHTYEVLGKILDKEEESKEIIEYINATIDDVETTRAIIPENDVVSVYYAEGIDGLQTDPAGSMHSEVLDYIGARNVANFEATGSYGRTNVDLEQIINWDPEFIITDAIEKRNEDPTNCFYHNLLENNKAWSQISAVKNEKILGIPQLPFSWFDRPPSVNRVLGVKWLSKTLYPSYYDYEVKDEVKKFYKLFYHYDLTDEELRKEFGL